MSGGGVVSSSGDGSVSGTGVGSSSGTGSRGVSLKAFDIFNPCLDGERFGSVTADRLQHSARHNQELFVRLSKASR